MIQICLFERAAPQTLLSRPTAYYGDFSTKTPVSFFSYLDLDLCKFVYTAKTKVDHGVRYATYVVCISIFSGVRELPIKKMQLNYGLLP